MGSFGQGAITAEGIATTIAARVTVAHTATQDRPRAISLGHDGDKPGTNGNSTIIKTEPSDDDRYHHYDDSEEELCCTAAHAVA
jgi:hypothetical protein